VVNYIPRALYSGGMNPGMNLTGGWVIFKGSRAVLEKRKVSMSGIKPWIILPIA
jgi:hypothetical protein